VLVVDAVSLMISESTAPPFSVTILRVNMGCVH
jgi:hypothetical protein